ncbi:head GIN domain-containing protein [Parabacteroides sp. PF5-6]|uniref:head GIN domain-containing protein n=1 Tax=Parabacteroides sp. PF5-6 TaxID=1742403 RepID=UPI002404C30A|nr:head GIN domain-containing protein [Parabacteroides sp. PF5-6]MDF9830567.1 hypothetical protein [Parabacteroides sp. PF5-6]
MKEALLVVSLCCLSLIAWAADPVKGNGVLTTEKVTVSDFNEIRINGPMAFQYEQSDVASPFVEVTIDENLYPHLVIEVKNRELTIEFRKIKIENITQFTVKSNSPWLKEARLAGNAALNIQKPLSGDEIILRGTGNCLINCTGGIKAGTLELLTRQSANIIVNDLEAEELKCDMDGSGSIRLKGGKAVTGKYSITGSNDLHAFDAKVADLSCKITGSGMAEIQATEKLKVSIIGKGTVKYKGIDPDVQTTIGKGTITKIE